MKTKNIKVVYTSRYSKGNYSPIPKVQMERHWLEELDLCQYFGQKKLKDYTVFLVLPPPSVEVSYNQCHYESFYGYTRILYIQRPPSVYSKGTITSPGLISSPL